MPTSTTELLSHVRDETAYLQTARNGLSRETYLGDATLKRAFVRSIEIISACAAAAPAELRRRYPAIDWTTLAAINDHLIHPSFGADPEIIWDFSENIAPELRQEVDHILGDVS